MNYNSTGFFPKFDPKIYWSFGVLLCLGIFLFIFQCSRHVDCEEANFYVFADNYAVKEVIEFGDKTKNIRKIILKESTYRTSISKKYFNSFVLHLINIQQFKI